MLRGGFDPASPARRARSLTELTTGERRVGHGLPEVHRVARGLAGFAGHIGRKSRRQSTLKSGTALSAYPCRERVLRKSEPELPGRRVSIQGGDQDALGRRTDEGEDEPVDNRDAEGDEKARHPARQRPKKDHNEHRKREEDEDSSQGHVT